jgi:hypothetical protein
MEADACRAGFGGFLIVGTTMYYFAGKWTPEEIASFDSKEKGTLNTNALEMATQYYLLYFGVSDKSPVQPPPLVGQAIMPKCDNDTTVVLKGSYRARNEHLALLLEDYDSLSANHSMRIPGVLNTASDELSRVGVYEAFFNAVRTDFPFIVDLQDVSELLPPSIRSLENLL